MKSPRFILLPLLLSGVIAAAVAHAEVSAGERKKIVELMDILGAENISKQVAASFANQLAYTLKQTQPDLDEKAFTVVSDVTNEVLEARSKELLEKMIPLYGKHFTESDIDELLAYYRSPIGRKMIATMPALMQESMEIAIKESQASIPQIQEKVTAKLRAERLIESE